MSLKSNVSTKAPTKERFAKEIDLLSLGYFNPVAFPDGKITVYPWDNSFEEFVAKRAQKGEKQEFILWELFPKVCDLKGCNPKLFPAMEALLIIMVSRAITRNSKIDLKLKCPDCGNSWNETLTIPEQLEKIGEKKQGYPGYDVLQLPECKDFVMVSPMTIGDSYNTSKRSDALKDLFSDSVAEVLAVVKAVAIVREELADSRVDNPMEAFEWFKRLPPSDVVYLSSKINELTPQLSTTLTVECPKCETEFKSSVDLNASFFRPTG